MRTPFRPRLPMPSSTVLTALTALTVLAGLAGMTGCAPADQPAESAGPVGGEQRTTAAALAWVTAEHLGKPASASAETDISGEMGAGAVGADLLYRPSEGDDGDRMTVAVGKGALDELDCNDEDEDDGDSGVGCVKSARGTVLWERGLAGEDPGNVAVGVRKGAATVVVFQSGPSITGDPRRLDLPVTVREMFELAQDPRIDVTTSKAAVDAGESLPYWKP